MPNLGKLGIFLAVALHSIVAEFHNPYPPLAAVFGPKNRILCNAVVLDQGRILTPADCLYLKKNKSYSLGRPDQFHVALETHTIEQYQNGKAFVKGSKWRYLNKLREKFGPKYDNKFGNGVFSDKLKSEETKYLLKALRLSGFDPKDRSKYVAVRNFTVHPSFKSPFINDLAILDIGKAYPVNHSSIMKKSDLNVESAIDQVVTVYGFGALSHGANETNRTVYYKARTVEMFLLSPNICRLSVGDLFDEKQHLCLGSKDNQTLCFGFTGAPIVLDGKVIGVVEFGHVSCSLNAPVVGIRLDAFDDFLKLGSHNWLDRIRRMMRDWIKRFM